MQTNELNVHHKNERNKRLDLVAEADGKKINVELNTSFDTATKVRNLNYYFSFCSQKAKIGQAYDIDSEFIHISLNYNMKKKGPIFNCFCLYDPKNCEFLDERYKFFAINLEKVADYWYTNNSKEVEKRPILTMLGIKEKEDLLKYVKESKSPLVKQLMKLNKDTDFVYQFSPAEDDELIKNTRIYGAQKKGEERGIEIGEARGEERNKVEIAQNLINMNTDLDFISKATGLSVDKLESIKENM